MLIKNDPVKKATSFFAFMEGVQLPHDQAMVLEAELFTAKVFSRLYPNSKHNILANFNLVLSIYKNFRVSGSFGQKK